MIFYVLWWYWNTGDGICIGVIRWITVDGWVTRSSPVTAFIYTIAGSLQLSKSITTSGGWTGLMNEYSLQFLAQLIKMFNLTLNTIETKKGGDIHMCRIYIKFLSTWPKCSLLIILHLYGYITHKASFRCPNDRDVHNGLSFIGMESFLWCSLLMMIRVVQMIKFLLQQSLQCKVGHRTYSARPVLNFHILCE